MRKRNGDRRKYKRFDVEGHWGGTLASTLVLQIANLGPGGALVEALTPLPVHSVHAARLVLGDEETDVRLRVCHARAREGGVGGFLLGVEFLELSEAAAAAINELLVQEAARSGEGDWEPEI